MPVPTESFDLSSALAAVSQALGAIVCHIGFLAAVHGLILSTALGGLGFVLLKKGRPAGRPLLVVFKKIAIFCLFLMVPGAIALIASGHLPAVGQLRLNSVGLFGFWVLVLAHFCMEEMNFEWFPAEK